VFNKAQQSLDDAGVLGSPQLIVERLRSAEMTPSVCVPILQPGKKPSAEFRFGANLRIDIFGFGEEPAEVLVTFA
jgi:hypothetical protein